MKLGKFSKGEKEKRINTDIHCSNCKKEVPGGLKVGENYSKTQEFEKELVDFKKSYLCGVCRDEKRRN